jgi:sugar-specific transcriptional regulator TrmB
MIQDFLKEIGFSDKEAEIYLALIKVDSDTILDLSKKTKIGRTTIYPIIEDLKRKGFVGERKENSKTKYFAESPERLNTFLLEQSSKIEEQQMRLKDVIPQIKSISKESGQAPIIKYYEGREGVLNSLNDFLSSEESGGTAYFLYPLDVIDTYFTKKDLSIAKNNRLKKEIKGRAVYSSKEKTKENSNNSDRVKIEYEKEDPIKCDVMVYNDKTRFITLGKSFSAIYIKNKDIADTMRFLIEELHKTYKKKTQSKK